MSLGNNYDWTKLVIQPTGTDLISDAPVSLMHITDQLISNHQSHQYVPDLHLDNNSGNRPLSSGMNPRLSTKIDRQPNHQSEKHQGTE